jgi:hypothetical protein
MIEDYSYYVHSFIIYKSIEKIRFRHVILIKNIKNLMQERDNDLNQVNVRNRSSDLTYL